MSVVILEKVGGGPGGEPAWRVEAMIFVEASQWELRLSGGGARAGWFLCDGLDQE